MALNWFDYLLNPGLLLQQLDEGVITESDAGSLMKEFLVNLLNSQNQGFFSDTPYELWFCESPEKKVPVIRSLCLQLAASLEWRLGTLESILPPPLILYVLQAYIQMQPPPPGIDLSKVATHPELSVTDISNPGPVLHSLILFHRWIVRYYMQCRTPQRVERASNVTVPGVRKEPALIYRDQTNNFVMTMFPTSVRFLQQVVQVCQAPLSTPTPASFTNILQQFNTESWTNLKDCNSNLVLGLVAYDLGSCFFFNEEYSSSTECFNMYFQYAANLSSLVASDVNDGKLKGYLMCLGLAQPPPPTINNNISFIESVQKLEDTEECADKILMTLADDTLKYEITELELDSAELQITRWYGGIIRPDRSHVGRPEMTSQISWEKKRMLVTGLQVYSLVRRILKGLPLTGRNIEQLQNLGETGLQAFEVQVFKIQHHGSSRDKRLMRNLVQKLVFFNVLPITHSIVANYRDEVSFACLEVEPVSLSSPTTLSETFNLKKICKYNAAVQLLATFQVPMLTSLAANIGGSSSQVTHRWHMEEHYSSRIINKMMNKNFDEIFIILSKVNQLKKMGKWDEATSLLVEMITKVMGNNSQEKNMYLSSVVMADKVCIDILKENEKLERDDVTYPDKEILRQAEVNLSTSESEISQLQELCLNVVLHSGDWESVSGMKLPPSSLLSTFARSLNSLMLNINTHLTKKFAREVWETMIPFVSSSSSKRKEAGQPPQTKERNQLQRFLELVSNLDLALMVLSLLSGLYNVAKDDPSTELVSAYPTNIWPTGLSANTSVQTGLVESFLQPILHSYMKRFPKEANIVLTLADLNFANGNYRSALALYVETVSIRTDFFEHPIEQVILPDAYVNRMIRCCSEMGRLLQAVVLSQFCVEPNYAQVFKYVEDRDTCDAADSLYSCIWDMSILEFAMSLHTRRGEVARRRHILSCIMQLELNTNNETEIKRAAANIRKSVFFRSLAAQLFCAPA